MQKIHLLNRVSLLFIFLFTKWICAPADAQIIATNGSITRSIDDFYGFNGTNIVRIFGWDNPQLPAAVGTLNSGMLRYPGGAYANWWDWRTGWFKDPSEMPPGVVLPGKYILSYSFDDRLEQYKKVIDGTGQTPIYVLNMISASLEDQVAMLYRAQCLNLPVKYIELGKEFYDDDPSVLIKYPTAEAYAADILLWTNELLKHFPLAQVAFVGAYEYNNDSSPYSRRKLWNTKVCAQLALYGIQYPVASSAAAMYIFQSSGNPGVNAPISTPGQVSNLMEQGYKILDHVQTTELPHLTYTPEVWVTETNLMDQGIGVHGTWAHGLFSVLIDMRYLEETKIKRALIHNLISDGIYSALFDDSLGFCFTTGSDGGGFIPPIPASSNCNQYPTNPLQKSAIGNALAQMGAAMFRSTQARKIAFNNAPNIPGTFYKTIYGWKFSNTSVVNSEQLVILNLDGTQQTLDISALSLGGNLAYQQVSASPYTPIQGDMSVTTTSLSGNTFVLPPYSITRVYKTGVSALNAFATSNIICSGNGTSLHARGANSYTWSPASGLSNTSGPDVDANPASTTTYTVTDNFGNTRQVTITVLSASSLVVSGLPSGNVCQGQTLTLTATGGSVFNWVPKTLTSNGNGSSVTISPQVSTSYTVNARDGLCYCGEATFNINVGGEVNLGNDHVICSGTADTLATGNNNSFTYSWTSSDGSLTSSLAHPVVTPSDTTIYFVQSTEAGCTFYDTLVVNTMNCCTGGVTVTNSNVNNLQDAVSAACGSCVQNGNTVTIRNYAGDIFVNGILTLEKNLTFINCPNVKFNHAGKVNVLQNYKLTLDSSSVLKDCNNEMWQGVSAYDANSVVRLSNGSSIQHAETAIDCSIDSKLYLENANLIDNYISVKLHDYLKAFIGNIYGTNFLSTSNTSLITPHAGQRTNCHFIIRDVASARIGDELKNPNTFSYFDYGIKADSVELTIKNSNFQHFTNTLPGPSFNGIGLDILGTNENIKMLTIGGSGTNEKLSFSDGYLGINATGDVSLNIKGNYFINLHQAVNTSYCSEAVLSTTIDILQDSITNCNLGIRSSFNSNSIININQNYIGINPDSSTGIFVEDLLAGSKSKVTISGNTIYNTDLHGIYLNQPCYSATVFENKIYNTVPPGTNYKSTGIEAYNSDSINILHNYITSINNGSGYSGTYGIFIQNSTQSNISDNSLNYFERGVNCNGPGMNPSRIKCTLMNSCNKGIILENGCVLGPQGDSVNNIPWNNQWVPPGFYDVGNPGGNFSVYSFNSNGNLSKFYTASLFPYLILTSGLTGTGSAIPSSTIPGAGTPCLPPIVDSNDNFLFGGQEMELFLYPNPVSKDLHVLLKQSGNISSTLKIFNLLGNELFSEDVLIPASGINISVNNISSGIYIIEVITDDFKTSRKEFAVIKN